MTNKLMKKLFAGILVLVFIANLAVYNTAEAALIPGGAAGPINPATGFPYWYKDQEGLMLELMEASDAFSISDPVDPNNPFSQKIGFNAEAFWWSAEADVVANGIDALVVNAMEAAFAGEAAVDGEQSAFGRVRFKIDVPVPGIYTVRHPFGTEIFEVTSVGDGPEIKNAGMGGADADIGCFATLTPPVSCDPNSPNGNHDPKFNFSAPLQSNIGPFLTWNTFNTDPALSDPALINLANPGKKYIGNPLVKHEIKGSPVGQNFFEVAGPDGRLARTTLFNVSGRIADIAPVLTSVKIDPANVSIPSGTTQQFTATALDQFGTPLSPQSAITWSSDNDLIGTLDTNGLFSALSEGTVSVSASAGTVSDTTTVTVTVAEQTPVLTSIIVNPSTLTIPAGGTRLFTASGVDQFGNPINISSPIVWTSSNPAVGTINPSTGFFATMGAGASQVTAVSGTITGSAAVTVTFTALQAVGPTDPTNGFPLWYQASTGVKLGLCLKGANGLADPKCVLPAAGEEATFNPTKTISFPDNFPSESFYYIADSSMNVGPKRAGKAVLRMALEAAFASGRPQSGQQITFLRVNLKKMSGLTPNSNFKVTYPFGTFNFSSDRFGNSLITGAGQSYRAEDGSFAAGAPNVFSALLPATSTNISKFLGAVSPAAPAGYIGNPGILQTISSGPNGNVFKIEGPNIGGKGVNVIQRNLWNVAGRIDTTPTMARVYSIDPRNNEINVPLDKTIVITFSENIEEGTTYSGITLKRNKKKSKGEGVAFVKTIVNNLLFIDPISSLDRKSTYTLFLPENAVEYISETYLPHDYYFNFTTARK